MQSSRFQRVITVLRQDFFNSAAWTFGNLLNCKATLNIIILIFFKSNEYKIDHI